MVKCAVPTCPHDSRRHNKKNNNVTFHRVPKNQEIANKWVKAIRRPNWEPNVGSFVCSVHFKPESISEAKQGYRLLVSGAIPELNIPDLSDPLYGVPSYNESMVDDEDCIQINEENTRSTQPNNQSSEPIKKESPSSSQIVLVRDCLLEPSYTPREMKLKRHILHLRDVANRRRLRCNALYNQVTRFKKKISRLNELLTELRKKDLVTEEQKCVKKEIQFIKQDQKNVKKEQDLETQEQTNIKTE